MKREKRIKKEDERETKKRKKRERRRKMEGKRCLICEIVLNGTSHFAGVRYRNQMNYTKENLVCITLNTYTFITNLFFWIFFFSIKLSNKYLLILPPCYSLGCISILVVFIKCKLIKYKKKNLF